MHHEYSVASELNGVSQLASMSEREMFEVTGKMIVDRLPESVSDQDRKDVFGEVERSIAMAALQSAGFAYGLTLYGVVSGLTFFLPGLKYWRQSRSRSA